MKEGPIKWFRREGPAPVTWLEREIRAAHKQRESGKRRGGPTSKRPWDAAR